MARLAALTARLFAEVRNGECKPEFRAHGGWALVEYNA